MTPESPRALVGKTIATGLPETEAAERLRSEGPNELPTAKPKSALALAAEVLREPARFGHRDGQKKRIAGREVVRGDIMLLAEGDRVAADALVVSGVNLTAE